MRKLILTISFLMLASHAQSQIDWLRYNDNFSHLKKDTIKQGTGKLKHLPLGTCGNISFGGEVREQMQYYRNFNFGDPPSAPDRSGTAQLWQRIMAHANIELGKNIRIFTQLGSTYRFLNPNRAIPEIDENHLSIHQLFGEYRFNKNWIVRVGRQEMGYGNHRLVTFREGPNTRLAFDAAAIKYNSERRKLDIIALSPVVSRKGIFDDGTFKDFIFGAYATEKLFPRQLLLDYYFLNFESTRRRYNYREGIDSRRVAGFRVFSQNRVINYEAEATYQFGKFNTLRINAYSLSADINTDLMPQRVLTLGIAGNYVSGDKSDNDNELNTYNPLFSKPQYGLTAPIGASNIITMNPYLRANPVRKFSLLTGVYFLKRQSDKDGSYSPDGTELRPGQVVSTVATKKEIGTLLLLESSYVVNNHLSFAVDASKFFAGKFLHQTGNGKDIAYLSFKFSYKF